MKDNTSVFHKEDKAELQAILDNIKGFYLGRIEGEHVDGKAAKGAIVNFSYQDLNQMLKEYKSLTESGYTLVEELTTVTTGHLPLFWLHMRKPSKEQTADLKPLFAEAEQKYKATISAFNNEVVERQVALMVAQAEKKRGQARAQEELDEVARIRAMVVAELGAPV